MTDWVRCCVCNIQILDNENFNTFKWRERGVEFGPWRYCGSDWCTALLEEMTTITDPAPEVFSEEDFSLIDLFSDDEE